MNDNCKNKNKDLLKGFPSISHIDISENVHSDDSKIAYHHQKLFCNKELVITEKIDGGNCCLYNYNVYARTHSHSANHPSFSTIKALYYEIQSILNEDDIQNLCIFGENMTAIHSIEYNKLSSYFYLFGTFDYRENRWYSWNELETLSKLINVPTVPLLCRRSYKNIKELEKDILELCSKPSQLSNSIKPVCMEGCVIRYADSFNQDMFSKVTMKYVKKQFKQVKYSWKNSKSWKKSTIIKS